MSRGHKRGSGERSNMYSQSKFTNWRSFDPYTAEINALPSWTETNLTVETRLGNRIAIVVRDTHPNFLSPATAQEVQDILLRVPPEFLAGLTTVYLLGGTSKQDKVAFGKLFRYGCYQFFNIYLHAFPKRMLTQRYSKLPPPDVMQEYERIGAKWIQDRDGWLFQFSLETLRAFYLRDVLLHEVGHHVDRPNLFSKNDADCERYAHWFRTFCEQNLDSV